MLDWARDLSLVKGFHLSRGGPTISHLLYVDNILLFGHASVSEVQVLSHCLKVFSSWSSQALNPQKSSIFISPNTNWGTARDL